LKPSAARMNVIGSLEVRLLPVDYFAFIMCVKRVRSNVNKYRVLVC